MKGTTHTLKLLSAKAKTWLKPVPYATDFIICKRLPGEGEQMFAQQSMVAVNAIILFTSFTYNV